MKRRPLPKHVTEYVDSRGKPRLRYRRKGVKTYYFKCVIWSAGFMEELRRCEEGTAITVDVGADRVIPGSFNDLIAQYLRSSKWVNLAASTRNTYSGIIKRFRAAHGHRLVAELQFQHVEAILAKMADTPSAANNLRKFLRMLINYACRLQMRKDNPVSLTEPLKVDSEGFHAWTEDEIRQFENRWPIGTKPRLALGLMLYTGQRRSDAVVMGRQHRQEGRIRVKQVKTGKMLMIPEHPDLTALLNALPVDNMTFLLTSHGKPFTPAGFGNWFREACDEAGLPQCASHGLRKAMTRRLAELGLSHQVIKSITGHETDKEIARYSASAEQTRLADQAMGALASSTLANRKISLAKDSVKPLKEKHKL